MCVSISAPTAAHHNENLYFATVGYKNTSLLALSLLLTFNINLNTTLQLSTYYIH